MKSVELYLRNLTDMISILQTLEVPPHAYLVTLDIESLYTNIAHEEAIASFLKQFRHHPQKVFVHELLKLILKINVFQFNDYVFARSGLQSNNSERVWEEAEGRGGRLFPKICGFGYNLDFQLKSFYVSRQILSPKHELNVQFRFLS